MSETCSRSRAPAEKHNWSFFQRVYALFPFDFQDTDIDSSTSIPNCVRNWPICVTIHIWVPGVPFCVILSVAMSFCTSLYPCPGTSMLIDVLICKLSLLYFHGTCCSVGLKGIAFLGISCRRFVPAWTKLLRGNLSIIGLSSFALIRCIARFIHRMPTWPERGDRVRRCPWRTTAYQHIMVMMS